MPDRLALIDDAHYFGVFAALAAGAEAAGVRRCSPYDEPFAEFYDVEVQGPAGDLAFHTTAAERCGGPVLDLACGSGRIAAALGRAGLEVDGIDRSPAMLARATARDGGEVETVRLILGDALDPVVVREYALIVVGATMFGGFLAAGGVPWLRRLRALVAPGGGLCFDVGWEAEGGADLRVRSVEGSTVLQGFAPLPDRQGHVFNAYAERDLGALGRRHLASETILTPRPEKIARDLEAAGWEVRERVALVGADAYLARAR